MLPNSKEGLRWKGPPSAETLGTAKQVKLQLRNVTGMFNKDSLGDLSKNSFSKVVKRLEQF